jgi:hypothetical protein
LNTQNKFIFCFMQPKLKLNIMIKQFGEKSTNFFGFDFCCMMGLLLQNLSLNVISTKFHNAWNAKMLIQDLVVNECKQKQNAWWNQFVLTRKHAQNYMGFLLLKLIALIVKWNVLKLFIYCIYSCPQYVICLFTIKFEEIRIFESAQILPDFVFHFEYLS